MRVPFGTLDVAGMPVFEIGSQPSARQQAARAVARTRTLEPGGPPVYLCATAIPSSFYDALDVRRRAGFVEATVTASASASASAAAEDESVEVSAATRLSTTTTSASVPVPAGAARSGAESSPGERAA